MKAPVFWTAGLVVLSACAREGEPFLSAAQLEQTNADTFVVDLWPGEGIPVIQMRRTDLALRIDPGPSARVADTLRGRVGQRVAFDSTRYETVQPGAFRFTKDGSVTGRDFGGVRRVSLDLYYHGARPQVSAPVAAQSTIEFLQDRAEGTCFVRLQGRVIEAEPCPGFGKDSAEIVREPVTRWWILVAGQRGRRGWLLVSDTTAAAVRREF